LVQSAVYRTLEELIRTQKEWDAALEAKGWTK
jgi:hypothetical protein